MKHLIVSFLCVIASHTLIAQKPSKHNEFKVVTTTEMDFYEHYGTRQSRTKEINQTHYNESGKKTKNLRTTYWKGAPYQTISTSYFYGQNEKIDYSESNISDTNIAFKTDYVYELDRLSNKNFSFISDDKEFKFIENYTYIDDQLQKYDYQYSEKYIDSDIFSQFLSMTAKHNKKQQVTEMDWTKSDSSHEQTITTYKYNRKGLSILEKKT